MSLDKKGSRNPHRVVKPQKYPAKDDQSERNGGQLVKVEKPRKFPMETWNMYYKSIALKAPELHVSPHKMAAFKVPGESTRSKGTTCPIQRGSTISIRIIMIKKPTQVDKYLRTLRTRRIYTRTVLVTITQNVPDKRTHRSKNHSVSPSVSSPPTKVTLECPDNNSQRSDDKSHETYPFSNIWDTKDTNYRHLVMQTKTIGKCHKQTSTCEDRKEMRQCTAKKPSTKDIVTAYRTWHIQQNKKSSQVSYTNYYSNQTCYTRLGTNGQEVNPLLDGVLRVHFSLDSIRQQSVKSNPQSILIQQYLENSG